MSAVANTPVEIWQKIFEYLLYDQSVVDPDPFNSQNSLHMSLIRWHSVPRLRKVEKQRNSLRRVSKAFKQLADSMINQFVEIQGSRGERKFSLAAQLGRCTRLHLGVKQVRCRGLGMCLCCQDQYDIPDQNDIAKVRQNARITTALFELPKTTVLPIKILVISASWFAQIDRYMTEMETRDLFSSVKALAISDHTTQAASISKAFPNLTYLNIHLGPFNYTPILKVTEWPTLTTLIMHVCHLSAMFTVSIWRMLALQHLEISLVTEDTETIEAMYSFLKRGWPSLRSFRVHSMYSPFVIREGFWDAMPNLEYFGYSWITRPCFHPPEWHPLHTIGLYDTDRDLHPRMVLLSIIRNWQNVKTVAEIYRWENIPRSYYKYSCDPLRLFRHHHIGPLCCQCIMDTTSICRDLGIRHEDRSGTTLTEFLTSPSANRKGFVV